MRTLSFTSPRGTRNKGVLFEPKGQDVSSLGFIFLPGSSLGTIAVHRLGIEIAQLLAEAGHPVYLFDHAGTGESEGAQPAGTHDSGSFVPETLAAVDILQKHTGSSRTALIGHCDGAVTSAYAGARHPSVKGLLLMNLPMTLGVAPVSDLDDLFRGRSHYRTLARILGDRLKGKGVPPGTSNANFNARLITDIERSVADGKSVSVVFGDRDPDLPRFEEFRVKHLPPSLTVRVLKDTSDAYMTEESQSLLFREISRFAHGLS